MDIIRHSVRSAWGRTRTPARSGAYNNAATQTLSAVLEAATSVDPVTYAERRVLSVIGMDDSAMTRDGVGNALTFMGLETTCRDLARFGPLVLRDGEWDGETVVSADFLRRATRQPSQPLNAAYGWLWWLNQAGPATSPLIATSGHGAPGELSGPLLPGAADDIFWALGLQKQIVVVIPSDGVVAVRMGGQPPEGSGFDEMMFTERVLDSLAEDGQ